MKAAEIIFFLFNSPEALNNVNQNREYSFYLEKVTKLLQRCNEAAVRPQDLLAIGNCVHYSQINFILEIAQNNALTFLDVVVNIGNHRFIRLYMLLLDNNCVVFCDLFRNRYSLSRF